MSSINGDKSRFNRVRKQRIFQRQRNRVLVDGLLASDAHPQAGARPPHPKPPATKPGDIQS
jgi:cold-inducible RNA-binding protein